MKTLVKGLTALLICGAMTGLHFENAEASDLSTSSVETQELARHDHYPPPPPPPSRHRHDRHKNNHDRYDDWGFYPPPPPPHHDGHRPHHR